MSSLVGFLSLVFAIGINFYLFLSRYIFKFQKQKFNLFIRFSSLLTLLSFFSLMYAYVVSDFSNYNVFQNSHSNKPLIYKISGTWGNHEGSMLLWLSILSIFSLFFFNSSACDLMDDKKNRILRSNSKSKRFFKNFIINNLRNIS